MQVNIIKRSSWRIPRSFIASWLDDVAKLLKKESSHDIRHQEVTLAFVTNKEMRSLNKQFRAQDKVTDILSFDGFIDGELGELVLCGDIVEKQAQENQLGNREELGYLLIHGTLHLLGYEHERGGKKAKQMFDLQDQLFDILRKRYF